MPAEKLRRENFRSLRLNSSSRTLARLRQLAEIRQTCRSHLEHGNTPTSNFERAAEAIVTGDLDTLKALLRTDPDLIRARSTREHHATLAALRLRQRRRRLSPENAHEHPSNRETAPRRRGRRQRHRRRLRRRRDHAHALAATSLHPEQAGVQEALLDLLLQRGASLRTGRPGHEHRQRRSRQRPHPRRGISAASRGAARPRSRRRTGPIEKCKSFSIRMEPHCSRDAITDRTRIPLGREYGRNDVVEFLLRHGADLRQPKPTPGRPPSTGPSSERISTPSICSWPTARISKRKIPTEAPP